MVYYLTQILAGLGCFQTYLKEEKSNVERLRANRLIGDNIIMRKLSMATSRKWPFYIIICTPVLFHCTLRVACLWHCLLHYFVCPLLLVSETYSLDHFRVASRSLNTYAFDYYSTFIIRDHRSPNYIFIFETSSVSVMGSLCFHSFTTERIVQGFSGYKRGDSAAINFFSAV